MTASKESDDKVLALWGREPAQKVAVCVALFSTVFYLVAAIAALAFSPKSTTTTDYWLFFWSTR